MGSSGYNTAPSQPKPPRGASQPDPLKPAVGQRLNSPGMKNNGLPPQQAVNQTGTRVVPPNQQTLSLGGRNVYSPPPGANKAVPPPPGLGNAMRAPNTPSSTFGNQNGAGYHGNGMIRNRNQVTTADQYRQRTGGPFAHWAGDTLARSRFEDGTTHQLGDGKTVSQGNIYPTSQAPIAGGQDGSGYKVDLDLGLEFGDRQSEAEQARSRLPTGDRQGEAVAARQRQAAAPPAGYQTGAGTGYGTSSSGLTAAPPAQQPAGQAPAANQQPVQQVSEEEQGQRAARNTLSGGDGEQIQTGPGTWLKRDPDGMTWAVDGNGNKIKAMGNPDHPETWTEEYRQYLEHHGVGEQENERQQQQTDTKNELGLDDSGAYVAEKIKQSGGAIGPNGMILYDGVPTGENIYDPKTWTGRTKQYGAEAAAKYPKPAEVDPLGDLEQTPGISDDELNKMLDLDRQQFAHQQARAMRTAMERGSRAGMSPEAMTGMQSETQTAMGAAAAGAESQKRMQVAMSNLDARRQDTQNKLAIAMAKYQRANSIEDRNFAANQIMTLRALDAKYQRDAQELQHRLDSEFTWSDAATAGLGIVGNAATFGLGRAIGNSASGLSSVPPPPGYPYDPNPYVRYGTNGAPILE